MTDRPSSVVIVLSFNGCRDTLECVASLVGGNPGHDVLVVDNHSDDGTKEALAEKFPRVPVIRTSANLGFTGGMNTGLRWALDHQYEFITILNNDTVVQRHTLDALTAATSSVTAVSPMVMYQNSPERAWFAGAMLDPADGLPRHLTEAEARNQRRRSGAVDDEPYPVELLAGCCIMARAATWRTVGVLDDRYFLNFEDSDWSLRAVAIGVQLAVVPRARIMHRVSASFTGQHAYLGTFYYARNLLLFAASWRSRSLRPWSLLWRRVCRPLAGQAFHGDRRDALRRMSLVLLAAASYVRGNQGRAPGYVERIAASWAAARA